MEDDDRRFLQEEEVLTEEDKQAKCPHENSETFDEDTGDSMRHVEKYTVFRCFDCGLEVQKGA